MRIFSGWIIAWTVLANRAVSIGPRQTFSVFLLPFVAEFGGSRSAVSAAFSIHMAFYALGGWILGIVMDRIGLRRIQHSLRIVLTGVLRPCADQFLRVMRVAVAEAKRAAMRIAEDRI